MKRFFCAAEFKLKIHALNFTSNDKKMTSWIIFVKKIKKKMLFYMRFAAKKMMMFAMAFISLIYHD